jgi:hypothetical protein
LGTSFFTIVYVAMLEEEDADAVLLSVPVAALETDAVASPKMREV